MGALGCVNSASLAMGSRDEGSRNLWPTFLITLLCDPKVRDEQELLALSPDHPPRLFVPPSGIRMLHSTTSKNVRSAEIHDSPPNLLYSYNLAH